MLKKLLQTQHQNSFFKVAACSFAYSHNTPPNKAFALFKQIDFHASQGDLQSAILEYNNLCSISKPSANIIKSLIRECRKQNNSKQAKLLWQDVQKFGIPLDSILVAQFLLTARADNDPKQVAEILQVAAQKKLQVHLGTVIQLFTFLVNTKNFDQVLVTCRYVNTVRIKLDAPIFTSIFKACATAGTSQQGMKIHNEMLVNGVALNEILATSLIHMYCRFQDTKSAIKVIHNASQESVNISTGSIQQLISLCAQVLDLSSGKDIHTLVIKKAIKDEPVYTNLIHMYCKNQAVDEAINTLKYMGANGIPCHESSLLELMSLISSTGLGVHVGTLSEILLKHDYLTSQLATGLLHMYAMTSNIEGAKKTFNAIKVKDLVTYNAMIQALGQHGDAKGALELFQELQQQFTPTERTYTVVLAACSHNGLVQEAKEIFEKISEPNDINISAMIDVYARAGMLDEAEELLTRLRTITLHPLTTIIGACRTHKDVERAERLLQKVIDITGNTSEAASAYVMVCNTYAMMGEFERGAELRRRMQEKGIQKIPGISSVQVNGRVHHFTVKDKIMAHDEKLKQKNKEVHLAISKLGYTPDVAWVTSTKRRMTHEEQVQDLCEHSERIAMVYAFTYAPEDTEIIITNNLRVCGDCHEATKKISIATNRTIIVRDNSRYHHFTPDGKCSCNDFF